MFQGQLCHTFLTQPCRTCQLCCKIQAGEKTEKEVCRVWITVQLGSDPLKGQYVSRLAKAYGLLFVLLLSSPWFQLKTKNYQSFQEGLIRGCPQGHNPCEFCNFHMSYHDATRHILNTEHFRTYFGISLPIHNQPSKPQIARI